MGLIISGNEIEIDIKGLGYNSTNLFRMNRIIQNTEDIKKDEKNCNGNSL